MSLANNRPTIATRVFNDYGMLIILLLLILLFSILTLHEQYPTGSDAGQQVAREILASDASGGSILIVTGPTGEDAAFALAASEELAEGGATVLQVVQGAAIDARTCYRENSRRWRID